jgi:uncharacterized protein (DUF433 family)
MVVHPRIELNVEVMAGKPVIRGTRVTVEQILRECAHGLDAAAIAEQYPRVEEADVQAALAFAADYLSREVSYAAE